MLEEELHSDDPWMAARTRRDGTERIERKVQFGREGLISDITCHRPGALPRRRKLSSSSSSLSLSDSRPERNFTLCYDTIAAPDRPLNSKNPPSLRLASERHASS